MARKENIVRYSAEELAAMPSETNWARVRAMSQDEVERLADEADGKLPEGWEETITLHPAEPKQDVRIRLDAAVLRWFRVQGPGYQTRINEVLRQFVLAKDREKKVGAR